MSKKTLEFPEGFFWGAATSAHQIEGGNRNDWTEWEKKNAERLALDAKKKWALWQQKKFPEMFDPSNYISGRACDHYNRYEEDFDIAKSLNLNAFRISLEWSRIEPEEGKFDEREIEHYRKVLIALKARGMKRIVTLYHWPLPLWFSKKYGWHKKESIKYFTRYCKKVIEELGKEIDIFISINEPRLPLNRGYLVGDFPPGKRNPLAFVRARRNMVKAQIECYELVKKQRNDLPVGITQFCNDFDFFGRSKMLNFLTEKVENFYNWYFFEELRSYYDFIGIDYYFGVRVGFQWSLWRMQEEQQKVSDMGWGIFSDGIFEVITDAWDKYHKPIYVFENGIADKYDKHREKFIKNHLKKIHNTIQCGTDVRGYFYWSLLDNFEWERGFWPRFGLVEVDYKTMKRKIRPSAWKYAKICKTNALEL